MVLITVVRGDQRRDLAVRGDVPIGELLGPVADALPPERPGDGGRRRRRSGVPPLGLAPVCGPWLPLERSLAACGVGHGAVLVLLDGPDRSTPATRR